MAPVRRLRRGGVVAMCEMAGIGFGTCTVEVCAKGGYFASSAAHW